METREYLITVLRLGESARTYTCEASSGSDALNRFEPKLVERRRFVERGRTRAYLGSTLYIACESARLRPIGPSVYDRETEADGECTVHPRLPGVESAQSTAARATRRLAAVRPV